MHVMRKKVLGVKLGTIAIVGLIAYFVYAPFKMWVNGMWAKVTGGTTTA